MIYMCLVVQVVLQSTGGLLVAMVLKYLDNIIKSYATALAIVVVTLISHVVTLPNNPK